MKHIVVKFANTEFARFLLVGVIAAAVNFLSRFGFNLVFSFRWSVIFAYVAGMLTSFFLSRVFVFEASGRHPASEFSYFVLVNIVAIIQVWVISVGLAEYLFPSIGFQFYPYAIAHFVGISVPVVTSYFGHKYWTFRKLAD